MAKTEKILKRFYNLFPPKKPCYSKILYLIMTFVSCVIFGIPELFETKSLLREGIYNI